MGMTIDESIENLVLLKKLEDSLGNISGNTNSVTPQSLECAIDTMRKYQKIEQILHNGFGKGVYAVFDKIVKVVEDGNDDNANE